MANRIATWPSGTRVVWRPLTWAEFKKARSYKGPEAVQALELYRLCKLEGPAPEFLPAGPMLWIRKYELEQSPFTGDFTKLSSQLQKSRDDVSNSYLIAAQALIVAMFRIPFSEVEGWDADTFLRRLAQAEFIAGKPLDPINPAATPNAPSKPRKQLTSRQALSLKRKHERDTG